MRGRGRGRDRGRKERNTDGEKHWLVTRPGFERTT